MADEKKSYKDVVEDLNLQTARAGFVEYPKMLHHPDGRTATVNSEPEASTLLGNGWTLSPDAALKIRKERDEADTARDARAAAEAAKKKN